MSDIFKDMQANVGCDYISNLPSYKRKVWHEMKRLPLTNYDIKQLEDFSKYVFGMSYQSLKKAYDYILIDCMPSLGMLTINALAAADSVIVPVQAHYLPLKGMTQLMKTIGKVQRQLNPSLKIDGVLLTLADMRTKLARTTEDSLRENYGKHIRIFKTVIPVAITAAESSAAGQSIYEYDKNGTVAKAYSFYIQ